MTTLEDRTIALAAILQASQAVQSLARTGSGNQDVIDTSLASILVLDAISASAIYGGVKGVSRGLRLLEGGVLVSPSGEHIELLRYTMSLLTLTEQLQKNPALFEQFGSAVENLSGVARNELPAACSEVYKNHVSGLQPQIIVQGEEDYLQREDIPMQIRSLLLAGIRGAVLWRQKGGGRFKLLWERTRMRNAAASLLQSE